MNNKTRFCEICEKDVSYTNFGTHCKTKKHIKKETQLRSSLSIDIDIEQLVTQKVYEVLVNINKLKQNIVNQKK